MQFKYFGIVLLTFCSIVAHSNTTIINGTVVDKNTNDPIPFVNIAVTGTYYGTVSNASGKFVLYLPNNLKNDTITFSCIGYETFKLRSLQNSNTLNIKLTPYTCQIKEITVMPDSALRSLIRKACSKIPENYPEQRTRSKGFYRDAMKEYNGNYLVLTEAILDVFKTSYKNKTTGQIRIDKSRKYIAPGIDSINNISFYGGHFIPHTFDLVKNRHLIVKASEKYKFKLSAYTKIDNRNLYVIYFEPSSYETEGYIGKMYIDKESLAFVKFEYKSNEETLKWREKELFAKLSSKEATKIILYAPMNGKYYLKFTSSREIFQNFKTGYTLEKFSEYTLIETDPGKTSSIPYNKISDYSDVITHKATPYFESDWRDYPVAQIDQQNQMSESVSDSIFMNSLIKNETKPEETISNKTERIERLTKLLSVLDRFSFGYNMSIQSLKINQGSYSLNIPGNNDNLNRSLSSVNTMWQLEVMLSYRLNKYAEIQYSLAGNLGKKDYTEVHKMGFSFCLPIKPYGKQWLMTVQPGYKIQNTMLSLGETNKLFRYNNGELSLKEGKSMVYWGEKSHGLDGRITLKYQMFRKIWLNAFAGYYYQLNSKPVLRFEDKSGNLFTKKKKNIELDARTLYLNINDMPAQKPKFELKPFYFGFGVVLTK